jgi:hypothetical protein
LSDATITANVPAQGDFSSILSKVTGFLDSAANTAKGVADESTRISRGIQGAAAGAKAGYNAPVNLGPYLLVGVGILVVGIAAAAAHEHTTRRSRSQ